MTLDLIARTPEETEAAEHAPVPPIAGLGNLPFLYLKEENIFITLDRRDGELCITYGEHNVFIPASLAKVLDSFLRASNVRQALALVEA
jgi:hypothetical protein